MRLIQFVYLVILQLLIVKHALTLIRVQTVIHATLDT